MSDKSYPSSSNL